MAAAFPALQDRADKSVEILPPPLRGFEIQPAVPYGPVCLRFIERLSRPEVVKHVAISVKATNHKSQTNHHLRRQRPREPTTQQRMPVLIGERI